jgi:hypothetical protein
MKFQFADTTVGPGGDNAGVDGVADAFVLKLNSDGNL